MSILNTDLTLLRDRINEVVFEYEKNAKKLRNTIFSGQYDKQGQQDYVRGLSGVGAPAAIGDRGVSPETTNTDPHSLTVTSEKLGLQLRIGADYLMWDKNMYNIGSEAGNMLARAWEDHFENVGANVLNRGFTTPASGGTPVLEASTAVALFSDSHLTNSGASVDNLLTSALSLDALNSAILLARYADDLNDRPWITDGGFVIHANPAQEALLKRLLLSPMDPTTANNSVNPVTNGSKDTQMLSYVVNPRLTSTTRWFVLPASMSERSIMEIKEGDTGNQYEQLGVGTNRDHVWDRQCRTGAFVKRYQGLVGSNI